MTDDRSVAVSWDQALAWRMRRQHLLDRAPAKDIVSVVDRMCALHAQVLSSAELAVWARTEGLARKAFHDALWTRRSLVKLWAMRGTLHVVPARQLGLWLSGLDTHRSGPESYGLRDPLVLELADLIGRALHDRVLSRTELAAEVERLSGSAEKGAVIPGGWGGSLKPASYLGQLCFAPSQGQQVRFTHPDTWLRSRPRRIDGAAALATITRKYLSAYGPAGLVDLAPWWGGRQRETRQVIEALGQDATTVLVDGRPYWMLTEDVPSLVATRAVTRVVRLLPGFDPWVVCACRSAPARPGPGSPALDPGYRSRVYRLQGWVSPVVVVNGRMAGVWRHTRQGTQLRVEIEPFTTLPRWTRQPIASEAQRLADYLGGNLQLTWSS